MLDGKRGYRHRGGLGAFTVAFLVAALLVMGLAASSASASPLSVKKVVTGDLPQLPRQFDLHQLDSSALRTAPGGAAGLFPIVPEPSSLGAAGDIFYDGFEPPVSSWGVAGDPTWGGTTYRKAAGSESAYCAGSAIAAPGPYANDMFAALVSDYINLSGVTSAQLNYKFYCVTEMNYDYVSVLVSADDFQTYGGWSHTGDSQGWMDYFIDLADVPGLGSLCGQSNVTIMVLFESDATNTYEGAYVDEVRVTGSQPPATATITSLTPTHAQTGASVVIAGSNLGTSGMVRFGSTSATTGAWSATSVTATVPASLAPGSVNVTVTPAGGSVSNALSFTVDPPSGPQQAQWVISGQPRTVKYKGYVTIRGTLSDAVSGLQLSGRRAQLCYNNDGSYMYTILGEFDAAPGTGQFTQVVGPVVRRTYYIWCFPGDGQYDEYWSENVKIMSRASLSRPGFPLKVRRGKRVTAVGTLKPQHSAAQNRQSHTRVYIYRYSHGKYRLLAKRWARAYNTSSVSKYKLRLVFNKTGKYRARAVHMDDDHAKTTSSWRTFRVR